MPHIFESKSLPEGCASQHSHGLFDFAIYNISEVHDPSSIPALGGFIFLYYFSVNILKMLYSIFNSFYLSLMHKHIREKSYNTFIMQSFSIVSHILFFLYMAKASNKYAYTHQKNTHHVISNPLFLLLLSATPMVDSFVF